MWRNISEAFTPINLTQPVYLIGLFAWLWSCSFDFLIFLWIFQFLFLLSYVRWYLKSFYLDQLLTITVCKLISYRFQLSDLIMVKLCWFLIFVNFSISTSLGHSLPTCGLNYHTGGVYIPFWTSSLLFIFCNSDMFIWVDDSYSTLNVICFLTIYRHQPGCARFHCTFVFNRKRNAVELELKQNMTARGSMKYVVNNYVKSRNIWMNIGGNLKDH